MFDQNLCLIGQNIVIQSCAGVVTHFLSCWVRRRKFIALGPVQYPKICHSMSLSSHTITYLSSAVTLRLSYSCKVCEVWGISCSEHYSRGLLECDVDTWQCFKRNCCLHLTPERWCPYKKILSVPCQKIVFVTVGWSLLTDWKEHRKKWSRSSTICLLFRPLTAVLCWG